MTVTNAGVRQRAGSPTPKPTGLKAKGTAPGKPRTLKGVLFGPPKTGKTTLACSGKNVLLVSFDPDGASTSTLQGRDDITVVEPQNFTDVVEIIKALHTTDKDTFEWAVFDSLGFMIQMYGGDELAAALQTNKDPRRIYQRTGAAVNQNISDIIRLRDTSVIFTAHLEKEYSEDDGVVADTSLGETEVKVAVTPMIWKVLAPAVSFIGRTYRGKEMIVDDQGRKRRVEAYKVSFNDGEKSPAGSRYSMEGEYLNTPGLLNTLKQELTERN